MHRRFRNVDRRGNITTRFPERTCSTTIARNCDAYACGIPSSPTLGLPPVSQRESKNRGTDQTIDSHRRVRRQIGAVGAGWDAAAAIFVGWVCATVGSLNPEETKGLATREDTRRVATSVLLLSASVASLVGVGFDLVKANQSDGGGRAALTVIAVGTVALSWGLVHTVFALRYAREYSTPPVGGIDFKTDDEDPDYQDFAYVAFTVGMTFQVSDADIQARRTRRSVLRHALLAYVFGAVIVAVVVNVIAGVLNT